MSGRDDLVADLTRRITARRPTVVVAPRRYGKTSLLGRVAADLEATVTVARFDLYELRSWADLAERLRSGLGAVRGANEERMDRLAASLDVNLGVVKASLARAARLQGDLGSDRLLDVLVTHAVATPTVAIFDEFSSIRRVDGAAGLLRTKLQHHYQRLGLVFAGSEPSTMRMLFADSDQPFYAQADLVPIPPLDLDAFAGIVSSGFDGAPPPGLARDIHAFTGGHPQRSMQLADAAWETAAPGVSDQPWPDALAAVRQATASAHETRFSAAAPAEQAVLRLLADRQPLFGRAAGMLALARSSAQDSRDRLLAGGHITGHPGGYVIVDPLYADWIAHRFSL